ncbi:MAG: SGNH/GDSL hydrolase family protein, partial [Clostridia bacterium]|nr:SGNH/GDSL hydrolase family protein [Clostridia bacterium]
MKRFIKTLCLITALLLSFPLSLFASRAENDTLTYRFSESSAAYSFLNKTNVAITYDSNEKAARIKATGQSPAASLTVTGFNSGYKYAVLVYRNSNTNSSGTYEGTFKLSRSGNETFSDTFYYNKGYKYHGTIIDISSAESASSATFVFFNNCVAGDNICLHSLSFCKTIDDAKSVSSNLALEANGPVLSKYTESELKTDSYVWQDYMIPYWDTDLIINEAVYPLKNSDGTISDFELMYDADRIISVRNSFLTEEYKEGVDYELVNGKLRVLLTGRIPCVNYSSHYFTSQKSNSYRMRNTSPTRYVRFEEGSGIPSVQLAVTYTHTDSWGGYLPPNQGASLPRTVSKLESGSSLKVILFGDSITNGGNSSGVINMAPYAEAWTKMLEREMKAMYPSASISFANTSVSGGSWDPEAVDNVQGSIINYNPDLVVLALGTNDYQFQYSASSTTNKVRQVVSRIKSSLPNCEIILVAPMLSNPECFDPDLLDSYISGYRNVASGYSGVVIADVNAVHKYLLTRKLYTDMSANNLCHLNDTLARTYAHVVLKTITPENLSSAYRQTLCSRINAIPDTGNYTLYGQSVISGIVNEAVSTVNSSTKLNDALSAYRNAKLEIALVPTKSEELAKSVDFTNIIFDASDKIGLLSSANNTTVVYNSEENAASLIATKTSGDPHVTIVFPEDNMINAGTHKYIVVT